MKNILLDSTIDFLKDQYLLISILLLASTISMPMEITNVAAALCLISFLVHDRFNNLLRGIRHDVLPKIILLYFILIVFSSLREETLNKSLDVVIKRLLIILPLFFYNLKISSDTQRRILGVYVLFVIMSCIFSLIQTLTQLEEIDDLYEFSWYLSNHSVISSNYLAVYTAFACIILFYSFFSKRLFGKILDPSLFVILVAYIALLGSRTAFFSMVIICISYLVVMAFKNPRLLIYAVIMLGGLLLLALTVPYFKSRIVVLFTVGFEADARYYEYLGAKEIFAKKFLTGVGHTGADDALVEEFQRIGFHEGVQNRFNAHNQFIQSALIFGVIGLAVVLSLYVVMIFRAFKMRNFLALSFCALFTLCSFTESLLERNKGIVFFGFFTGLLLCAKSDKDSPSV